MSDEPNPRRAKFIERWKRHVAGVIAMGAEKATPLLTGNLQKRFRAGEITAEQIGLILVDLESEATKLLGQIYDNITKDDESCK